LKKRSDERIATDRDFAWVRQEIERFKKLQAEKSISLNEAVRLKEKKEGDDRAKARKKDLAARPESPGKVYDITLKLAEQPGLPPPTVRTNQTSSASTNSSIIIDKARVETAKKEDLNRKVAKADKPKAKDADEDDDLDVTPVDINLDEAKRILIDYASLLNNGNSVAMSKPGPSPANLGQSKDGAVRR
jgi:carboxyl-terminal processing protease